MNEFNYLRRKFKPVGTLPKDSDFHATTRKCKRIGIHNYEGGKYSHTDFYNAARRAGCGEIDVFQMNGSTIVLPCENELFEYTGDFDRAEQK